MMPRNHYTKTSTGIVIGYAYISRLSPAVDEHTTLIQQVLLNDYANSRKTLWCSVLYVAALIGVIAVITTLS